MAAEKYDDHNDSDRQQQPDELVRPNNAPPSEQRNVRYHPFLVYFATAVTAIGGLLFGYDTGVISGAELYLKHDFHLGSGVEELAVSAVLIGAIFGAAFGGWLGDKFGRKIIIMVVAAIFAAGAIVTSISPNIWFFIVVRIIVGLALGMDSVMAPVYISEMAPYDKRGGLVTVNQFMVTAGIAIAYWIGLAYASAGLGWPPMFATAAIPSAIHFIIMFFLPDTPRWYASKGKWDKAKKVLAQFVSPEKRGPELQMIRKNIEATHNASIKELFRPGLRMALVVGMGLAIFQQFVGINTIIYYAPTIFSYAGYKSTTGAILATSVVGVVNMVSTLIVIFLMDRIGRRPLLLAGLVGMIITLIAIGIIFLIGPNSIGLLILIALMVYIISFAVSLGPVYWLMSSEIFPNRYRGTGSSFAAASNWGS
ncbi:MAG TPA: sugar porter family MFS transporter, partial [Ktedonobacteraceae bacterium]|nr:sugar porter family MFS transporter [Ktedonobacteraceae bacterium]